MAHKGCLVHVISIHTLRVEGDLKNYIGCEGLEISIHTLRVEGDLTAASIICSGPDFYPHPPCGG